MPEHLHPTGPIDGASFFQRNGQAGHVVVQDPGGQREEARDVNKNDPGVGVDQAKTGHDLVQGDERGVRGKCHGHQNGIEEHFSAPECHPGKCVCGEGSQYDCDDGRRRTFHEDVQRRLADGLGEVPVPDEQRRVVIQRRRRRQVVRWFGTSLGVRLQADVQRPVQRDERPQKDECNADASRPGGTLVH